MEKQVAMTPYVKQSVTDRGTLCQQRWPLDDGPGGAFVSSFLFSCLSWFSFSKTTLVAFIMKNSLNVLQGYNDKPLGKYL